jgi:hypothetical protein
VVSASANHADSDPVALVPSGVTINDVDSVPGVQVVDSTLAVDSPDLKRNDQVISLLLKMRNAGKRVAYIRMHRLVHRAPPDFIL